MAINFETIVGAVTVAGAAIAVILYAENTYAKKDNDQIQQTIAAFEAEFEGFLTESNQQLSSMRSDLETLEKDARTGLVAIQAFEVEAERAKDAISEAVAPYHRVTYQTGAGIDRRDDGLLDGRTLIFQKARSDTAMRVLYSDTLRVHGTANEACRWSLRFNNNPCPSGDLYVDRHVNKGADVHSESTLVGFCEGLPTGRHVMSVEVSRVVGDAYVDSDCYTGWNMKPWLLEAIEVNPDYLFKSE